MEEFGHIRSFVRRQGKMTPAQRAAYESLKDSFIIPADKGGVPDLKLLFPGKERIVVEIGFGMGKATAIIAESNPATAYIGMEVHTPGVGKLLWEIRERKLDNLMIVHDDAVPALRTLIVDESLDGVHIFFPDPWPKKRHQKRRLISADFLKLLAAKLKKGAYLYIVTDWMDYADQIIALVRGNEGFANPYDGYAPPISWRPSTAFERKGRKAERPIIELYFLKR